MRMPKPNAFVALLLAGLVAAGSAPASACDARLFELMDAALPTQPDMTFDVAEVDSTEGGNWDVYFARGTRMAENLVRTDFGEGGRFAVRLVVASPQAYAVTTTLHIYSAPIYIAGSTTIREEKNIYLFCDGVLYLPAEDFGPGEEYVASGKEALAAFDAAEVKEYLPALKR